MTQISKPISTLTTGNWSPQGATSLYECIDETNFSDTDYIRSSGGSASYCEVGLSTVADPRSEADHIIIFRMRSSGSGGPENIVCSLYQGSTLIASSSNQSNRSSSFAEKSFTLTNSQADSITDYSALRLRFIPSHGSSETIDVSWAQLQVPDIKNKGAFLAFF